MQSRQTSFPLVLPGALCRFIRSAESDEALVGAAGVILAVAPARIGIAGRHDAALFDHAVTMKGTALRNFGSALLQMNQA
jgi:hypothetical protein